MKRFASLGSIRLVETYLNADQDTVIAEAYVGPLPVLDKFVIRSGEIVEQENVFDPRPAPGTDGGRIRGLALDAFLARRADTLDHARATRDPLHHHAAPLGELGPLDAYQWLLLMAAHTDRHLAQMRQASG
jgi:hypothetical protein